MSIKENVTVKIVPDKKFKNTIVAVRFLNDLKPKNATIRALLAMIMVDRLEAYPTKQAVSNELDFLYGANISGKTLGYGRSQVVEIKINTVSERFVSDKLTERQFKLLSEMLFWPLINQETLNEAKKNLFEALSRVEDVPSQYSLQEALKIAGQGQPLGISVLGDVNDIEDITLEDVVVAHQQMLNNDAIAICVVGDVELNEIDSLVEQHLNFKARNHLVQTEYSFIPTETKEESIYKNVDQTELTLVYNTQTLVSDNYYWPLQVGNVLFGQLPISLLFQEVREKRSLAYSVYTQVIAFDSVLYISTGIQESNVALVVELVEELIDKMVNGEFSTEMINASKKTLINSLTSGLDSPGAVINQIYKNVLMNTDQTIEDIKLKINNVTKKEIQEVFSRMLLNTIFTISQEDKDATNS